jgi:hypothetical protein
VKYSTSMACHMFWFNETRNTAELFLTGKTEDEIREFAYKENIYQVRTKERIRRILGVTIRRLNGLTDQLIGEIVKGDIETAKLIVLMSIMKSDVLFFEFMHEVFRPAIMLGEKKVTNRAVNAFFDAKKAQSNIVARWSEESIERLKRCYPKMLFEAGVLNSIRGERNIKIPHIDYRVRKLISDSQLTPYLTVITGEE